MEPLNAVARLSSNRDRIEVWNGSQSPDRCREEIAEALGFGVDRVTVHQCYMGGAFGRRSLGDYAVEAALVARAVQKPVKLIWTREEDLAFGMFRPQSLQCLEAALDAAGKVVGWRHCVVGDGGGLLTTGIKIPYYEVPNHHIERRGVSHGIRLKHWRAVGHVFNVFAIESFVDEMAVDLATVVNGAPNSDEVIYFENNSATDTRSRPFIPKVIPGLIALRLGMRATAASNVLLEASVRVRHEDQRSSHGHGADTDIVVASAKAYISAINHVLSRHGTTRAQHPQKTSETPEVRA